MTTTSNRGNEHADGNASWESILQGFGVRSVAPPPPSRPSLPPPAAPAAPPPAAADTLPPYRAPVSSISPTVFDAEPAPRTAALESARPPARARRDGAWSIGLFGGLAVATLALAALWSHPGQTGALVAAASSKLVAPVAATTEREAEPAAGTALSPRPLLAFEREETFERQETPAPVEVPARVLSHDEVAAQIGHQDPTLRFHGPGFEAAAPAARPKVTAPVASVASLVPGAAATEGSTPAPAPESDEVPLPSYETTLIGDFAGKI